MKNNSISTEIEVKGILYMIEYIKDEYFPSVSKLKSRHYLDISIWVEDLGKKISKSTVTRIFKIKEEPWNVSLDKLDDMVYWCFSGEYFNFNEFIKEKREAISQVNISGHEIDKILSTLNTQTKKIGIHRFVDIELANSQLPVIVDGLVKKVIEEVSFITGDLLAKKIKENPRQFGIFPNRRIDERILRKESRRQSNIEGIIVKAIEFARNKEASDNPVDPDWIVEFFNIAQDSSHIDMQYLWAKLLANEIDKPHSISRRTLSVVKLLEPNEAQVFTALCNCIWNMLDTTNFKEKILIKDMYKGEEYSDETWGFDSLYLSHLESIGLINESFIDMVPKRTYRLNFFGKDHEIKSNKKNDQLEIICLTHVGKEIFNIIEPIPNKVYYEFTINYFKNINILKK